MNTMTGRWAIRLDSSIYSTTPIPNIVKEKNSLLQDLSATKGPGQAYAAAPKSTTHIAKQRV
jgi:hypothetical protein